MVSREVLATLVSIWPQIQAELETDLARIQARLIQAPTVEEIRMLQGRGKAFVTFLNLPGDLAKGILEEEEAQRQAELQRMNQNDRA